MFVGVQQQLTTKCPLDCAASQGFIGFVKWFHQNCEDDDGERGGFTTMALDVAAARGHLLVVKYLSESRPQIERIDIWTTAIRARMSGNESPKLPSSMEPSASPGHTRTVKPSRGPPGTWCGPSVHRTRRPTRYRHPSSWWGPGTRCNPLSDGGADRGCCACLGCVKNTAPRPNEFRRHQRPQDPRWPRPRDHSRSLLVWRATTSDSHLSSQ
ncbi:uncharacterized protein EV422DRAFT_203304 [Fimicolochytrium jonesii]|uniref:uncharacterized protein n=1 Tax=Fimicolochytrium jonesii TaxID=1396493 RepID=UPI0022FE3B45|nr:uncharacterized protein EV422DRAFT_203304 [Fimicolochytrium jonesii]KAI8818027.1 hypothetical protein EV422DRAFT_203304 [Fimicolochytrium jonesii]